MKLSLTQIGAILFIIVLGVAIIFGSLYFKEKASHANDNQLNDQKYAGLNDQLNQKADSIQELSIQVADLNLQKKNEASKKGYWMAIAGEYKGILDSVFQSGNGNSVASEDSIGKYLQVSFGGKENFVTYWGNTKYYPLPSAHSTYSLSLAFDTLDIRSDLIRDVDKLWKIKTVSNTPGLKLKTYYTIDSTIFAHLNAGTTLPIPESSTDWGLETQLAASHLLPNIVDVSAGGYYGGLSARYFVKEKTFWVDVTGKFSLRSWKFGW